MPCPKSSGERGFPIVEKHSSLLAAPVYLSSFPQGNRQYHLGLSALKHNIHPVARCGPCAPVCSTPCKWGLLMFPADVRGHDTLSELAPQLLWFIFIPAGSWEVTAPQMGMTLPSFSPGIPTPGLSHSKVSPFSPEALIWAVRGCDNIQK